MDQYNIVKYNSLVFLWSQKTYVSTLTWMVVVKKSGEALYIFSSFTNLSTEHAKLKGIKSLYNYDILQPYQ